MEFEDLQAIWDAQNERPAFSMNDSRLAVGLYQQREQSRRRLFREQFAPLYAVAVFMAVGCSFLFIVFLFKTISRFRPTDPLMTVWDGAALAGVVVAAVAVAVSRYLARRNHERTQIVFAPTLREELDRGISQLDFELKLYGSSELTKAGGLLAIGTAVFLVETARLNGQSVSWMLLLALACFPLSWYGFRTKVERLLERRRALESMRAALEEGALP